MVIDHPRGARNDSTLRSNVSAIAACRSRSSLTTIGLKLINRAPIRLLAYLYNPFDPGSLDVPIDAHGP